jgi:hypothetical protein
VHGILPHARDLAVAPCGLLFLPRTLGHRKASLARRKSPEVPKLLPVACRGEIPLAKIHADVRNWRLRQKRVALVADKANPPIPAGILDKTAGLNLSRNWPMAENPILFPPNVTVSLSPSTEIPDALNGTQPRLRLRPSDFRQLSLRLPACFLDFAYVSQTAWTVCE